MSMGYGIESQHKPAGAPHRKPARYLVVIDNAGAMVARLFTETREEVGEFDAGSEEVALMTRGLKPRQDANGSEWDQALEAHNAAERAGADVYTLDV
ncbi:hypothetical protein [Piscinibacter sakaiensis]|uniref:hypothetical protein n=1 Tax=Piscinibacter sakaiensis TaxID=1547922 RepID=UPI003AB0B258